MLSSVIIHLLKDVTASSLPELLCHSTRLYDVMLPFKTNTYLRFWLCYGVANGLGTTSSILVILQSRHGWTNYLKTFCTLLQMRLNRTVFSATPISPWPVLTNYAIIIIFSLSSFAWYCVQIQFSFLQIPSLFLTAFFRGKRLNCLSFI